MIAGNWINYDGLNLNFGTTKTLPEIAGEFQTAYGDQRLIECYLNLGANTLAIGHNLLPALPQYSTSTAYDANTTTLAAAGVISDTEIMPLQVYDNSTYFGAQSGVSGVLNPQIFLESVEVVTLIPCTSGSATSLNLGLAAFQTGQATGPSTWLRSVTSGTGTGLTALLNTFTNVGMKTAGQKVIIYPQTYIPVATGAGVGDWLAVGNMPVTTLTQTAVATSPLVQSAYLTAGAVGGVYPQGLLKIRIRYSVYGSSIPY